MKNVKSTLAAISIAIAIGLTGIALDEIGNLASRNAGLIIKVEREARAQGALAAKVAVVTKARRGNSVGNVDVWCGAIDEDRVELARLVPGWRSGPLDCRAIQAATVKSGGPPPAPTGVSK